MSSFCSLSGYTVLTRYRDYLETDKNQRIFHYFAAGCNRDGLALRVLGQEAEEGPWEHKMIILLSDAKPNDVVKMPGAPPSPTMPGKKACRAPPWRYVPSSGGASP